MNLSNLTSARLRSVISLVEQKEQLLSRAAKIDQQIAGLLGGEVQTPLKSAPPKAASKATGPAAKKPLLKDVILSALRKAGPGGIGPKQIAERTGRSEGAISVWLYTTGKTSKAIKKVAPGRYVPA